MKSVELLLISLDKKLPIYTAGETIKGHLKLKIAQRLKINNINIGITGKGRVLWSETYSTGKGTITIPYYSSEDYLDLNMKLVEKNGIDDLFLEVGDYEYPFQFPLPANLPTSYEHTYGRIRYSINGEINIPWSLNKHVKLSITVICPLDLNLNPALRQPSTFQDSKTICCWCCKSEPINATLSIPKGGFVPGEKLTFNAIIDNKSNTEIKSLTFKIIEKTTLIATMKTKIDVKAVIEVPFNKTIAPRSYVEWKDGSCIIPSIIASSNENSKIIKINYEALINVNPKGPSISLDVPIPITIGTVPLMPYGEITNQSFLHNYERSYTYTFDNKGFNETKEGEVTEMDENYAPFYPYYEDFSIVPS